MLSMFMRLPCPRRHAGNKLVLFFPYQDKKSVSNTRPRAGQGAFHRAAALQMRCFTGRRASGIVKKMRQYRIEKRRFSKTY